MKIMSDKKFNELMIKKDEEHANNIHDLCNEYEHMIDLLTNRNIDLKIEKNDLERELNYLEQHKIRYLRMIENKSFKSKRLKKKYKDKLEREIKLLFGGEK